jgi:hypothetical protein
MGWRLCSAAQTTKSSISARGLIRALPSAPEARRTPTPRVELDFSAFSAGKTLAGYRIDQRVAVSGIFTATRGEDMALFRLDS